MAVTIYQVLNLSESILEPFKDKPFLLTNYFLSSATYIHNIYTVLNFSENLLGWEDDFLYVHKDFNLTTLYARTLATVLPPDDGLDLHNNFLDKLKLRLPR